MRFVAIEQVPAWDPPQQLAATIVFEQERVALRKTSLLNAQGIPFYEVVESAPLGFDLRVKNEPRNG